MRCTRAWIGRMGPVDRAVRASKRLEVPRGHRGTTKNHEIRKDEKIHGENPGTLGVALEDNDYSKPKWRKWILLKLVLDI